MIAIAHRLIPFERSTLLSSLLATQVLAATKCYKIFLPVVLCEF
jgi:hypothetical protein